MDIYNICSKHFGDRYLQSFINSTGTRTQCDVCDKVRNCVSVNEIAQRIEGDLRREFDDPWGAGFSYDSEEGELVGGSQYETNELIEREAAIEPYEVVEAICQKIDNSEWASLDWQLPQSDYMRYGWQEFRMMVKHRMRFVFFSEKNHHLISENESDRLHPQSVLQEVGKLIKAQGITTSFEPGELHLFRARQHKQNEKVHTAAALGAPPIEYAQANRMSPEGISMFYGSFDRDTCIAEVTDYERRTSSVSSGKFTNRVTLRLIDFSKPLKGPSIFNPSYNRKAKYLREGVIFLQNFIHDLQQPLSNKDAYIEYVPTQVVCEYLRYMYAGGQVDGLIYGSVKNPGGRCVVLFVDNKQGIDEASLAAMIPVGHSLSHGSDSPKLVLLGKSVVRNSIRRLRIQRKKQLEQQQAEFERIVGEQLSSLI
ncbi:HEPN-associated N-terminal domain-containing protein [Hymenobacter guriensis]|uniref:RES domain-containing protein n=1 Tax=Hymenobacter guriensis TaxID=2793065 RepID=A0ABS0L4H2_9BACT|nr:HEPN-associated N-terminal domain-containing protein [Hymenobacter guriensis]MBG8555035.1 RES domain-containing protein [Hymenobacter guriensis]